ncbi:MAG: leucine-rich repeat domain-containing protein [Bacilli bacterium]|nr:leucine-rich repeat domain-containing protein [Bacilli bacterium]
MGKVLIEEENLTNIANAIRGKNGETTTYKPGDMSTAIQNIPNGGDSELEASYLSIIQDRGLNCTKLPKGLTSIGDYAFYHQTYLNQYNNFEALPNSITSIGQYAFYSCVHLNWTKLPNSITSIGQYAFYNCQDLAITSFPNGITSIPSQGFSDCTSLTSLELHSGITEINSYSFSGCSNLSKLIINNATPITLKYTTAFQDTPIANGTGYIYVPDESVESFKAATNWSAYADQIKPISELEVNA